MALSTQKTVPNTKVAPPKVNRVKENPEVRKISADELGSESDTVQLVKILYTGDSTDTSREGSKGTVNFKKYTHPCGALIKFTKARDIFRFRLTGSPATHDVPFYTVKFAKERHPELCSRTHVKAGEVVALNNIEIATLITDTKFNGKFVSEKDDFPYTDEVKMPAAGEKAGDRKFVQNGVARAQITSVLKVSSKKKSAVMPDDPTQGLSFYLNTGSAHTPDAYEYFQNIERAENVFDENGNIKKGYEDFACLKKVLKRGIKVEGGSKSGKTVVRNKASVSAFLGGYVA
jgi:hypothetical protein